MVTFTANTIFSRNLVLFFGMGLILFAALKVDRVHGDAPLPVETIEVKFGPYSPSIKGAGRLENKSEQNLAFKVGGLVSSLTVDEGQFVRKGQVIAKLDQEEIQAQVAKAQSVLTQADAKLKRLRSLEGKDFFSADGIQAAETAVAVAQSDLRVANFNLKYSSVVAPTDGVILKRYAEKNEWVPSGQPIFLFASQLEGWVFRLGVSDRNLVRLRLGDPAKVQFDAYPNRSFEATVSEIATRANSSNLTFEIEVVIDQQNSDNPVPFYSGLIGRVIIEPKLKQQVALIPLTALVKANSKQATVFVVESDNRVSLREFNIAFLDRDMVAVSIRSAEGAELVEGDRIVTQGSQYLAVGREVKLLDSGVEVHSLKNSTPSHPINPNLKD